MAVNIAQREDIPTPVLRQRRDLYAVGIALTIFYLAGGIVLSQGTQGMIPLQLQHPWVVLFAAWIGFAYFLLRYRMMKRYQEAWSEFLEDTHWQLTRDKRFTALALEAIPDGNIAADLKNLRQQIEARASFPVVEEKRGSWKLKFSRMGTIDGPGKDNIFAPGPIELDEAMVRRYKSLRRRYLFQAAVNEHTFTNYLLPYCFSVATIALGFLVEVRRALQAFGYI